MQTYITVHTDRDESDAEDVGFVPEEEDGPITAHA